MGIAKVVGKPLLMNDDKADTLVLSWLRQASLFDVLFLC